MDVLHGNQSDPSRARRKLDQQPSDQRALNWAVRSNDIILYPHSPLALADVFTSSGGCFDLLSTTQTISPDTLNDGIVSLQQRRRRKNPRQRANLLTQHSPESLIETCRQIQIDNALIKKRGDKRLYLVAGFLTWPDAGNKIQQFRAPLLFFPAILLCKPSPANAIVETNNHAVVRLNTESNTRNDMQADYQYEVRLENNTPHWNPALYEHCRTIADITLPDFDPNEPLQDYFAHIASALADSADIELEFDIALGSSAAPAPDADCAPPAIRLPELPAEFDAALAMTITGNKNLHELSAVLHLLRDYSLGDAVPAPTISTAIKPTATISNIREYSKKLATQGLDHIEFKHLTTLPENIVTWTKTVQQALDGSMINTVLADLHITPRHIIKLAGAIELIDKSPLASDQYRHPDLCYTATPALMRRARHQAQLIEDEIASLQTYFVLDKVPAKAQLLNLIEELGGSLEHEPDIVDADYFHARRQFMEFSIEKPTNLTPDHRRMLSQLAKVLRFRELFVNNIEYRLALGPGYRGLRTDWAAIEQMLAYSQEFAEFLESESLASRAMRQWESFRTTFVSELESLQSAADALRNLLRVSGPSWQSRPSTDLLKQSQQTASLLCDWHKTYGSIESHASLSPASVLAQFSGKSREDVITEIHVGETQKQIDKHIKKVEASSHAVVSTLKWLREASEVAADHQLEIDAIVDHLQIA